MAIFGFIGTGNMGGAMATAARKAVPGKDLLLSNRTPEKAKALAERLDARAVDNLTAAREADYLFLGVKPQMMAGMLASIRDALANRETPCVLVSMAAGLTMARIREMAGAEYPIIRIMPNTPAAVGQGVVLCCSEGVDDAKLDDIKQDNMKQYSTVYDREEDKPFASGLCFEKLFALFVIGSFIGTCIETVYALIVEGHFECRVGLVYGPFIPVYGGGACMLTIALYKLYKLSDTLVFIIGAVIGAFFEYICSWAQETFLGTVSWDYSDMPLNIGGRTCLLYALFWGFLSLIWLRYIYPFVSKQIEKIPKKQGSIAITVLVVFMIVDAIVTVSAVYRWNQRVSVVPADNSFAEYIDKTFDDDRMEFLFPHMRDSDSLDELKSQGDATPDSAKQEIIEKQHE